MQLGKHSLLFGLSVIPPRLAAFIGLIIFTRIMPPTEYGYYALFIVLSTALDEINFAWLRLGLLRLLPEYDAIGKRQELWETCISLMLIAGGVALVTAVLLVFVFVEERRLTLGSALAVALATGAIVRVRLAEAQANERSDRFLMIEGSRAVLALVLSIAAVLFIAPTFEALLVGYNTAYLIVAVACLLPRMGLSFRPGFHRATAVAVFSYSAPIVAITLVTAMVPIIESFVIERTGGAVTFAAYSAAQNLVRQPIGLLFAALGMAAFTPIMRSAAIDDANETQRKIGDIGLAFLAVGLPAVAGFVVIGDQITDVVIGEALRPGVRAMVPFMAIAAFLSNWVGFFYAYSLQITKKMHIASLAALPALFLIGPVIYIMLRRYDEAGAAGGLLIVTAVTFVVSRHYYRRTYPFGMPGGAAARIWLATGVMCAALFAVRDLPGIFGLIATVSIGVIVYTASILALDVQGIRPRVIKMIDATSVKLKSLFSDTRML